MFNFLRRFSHPQPPPFFGLILPREKTSIVFASESPNPCGLSNFSSQNRKQTASDGRGNLFKAQQPPLSTPQSRQCVHFTISCFSSGVFFMLAQSSNCNPFPHSNLLQSVRYWRCIRSTTSKYRMDFLLCHSTPSHLTNRSRTRGAEYHTTLTGDCRRCCC